MISLSLSETCDDTVLNKALGIRVLETVLHYSMSQKVLRFIAQVEMKLCEKHDNCKQNLSTRLCLEGKVQNLGQQIFTLNQQSSVFVFQITEETIMQQPIKLLP